MSLQDSGSQADAERRRSVVLYGVAAPLLMLAIVLVALI
jgi:hypothetical protein